MKKRKQLEKKTPRRREGVSYWSEAQFQKLRDAPPGRLESRGRLPWRLLAFLLDVSPDLTPVREAVGKRLLPASQIQAQQKLLTRMLVALHDGGFVELSPPPPGASTSAAAAEDAGEQAAPEPSAAQMLASLTLGTGIGDAPPTPAAPEPEPTTHQGGAGPEGPRLAGYLPTHAHRTGKLDTLLKFRAVNPVYGAYLLDQLGLADPHEQMQILESVLEMPNAVARRVRVPRPEVLPPGPLALEAVDTQLIQRGLATQDELYPPDDDTDNLPGQPRRFAIPLAEKVRMLFDAQVDAGGHNPVRAVWAAGDLLGHFGGDFVKFVSARGLQRQEGVVFRHLLRLILLCDEFTQHTPAGLLAGVWTTRLDGWAADLTRSCRAVDPQSTDKMLDQSRQAQG